jgi:hypothetical protein
MSIALQEVRRGSVVMLRGGFGNDPPRRVTLTGVYADVKNGQPGVDYEGHWAYLDQIVKVLTY